MKTKILDWVFKILFTLILVMPILGTLGVFPPPTRELYNTDAAFAFIETLGTAAYIMWIMAAVHIVAIAALFTKREALAALLVLPVTVNVVGFHLFLDGGLFTAGAIAGNVMLALNLYFLWKHRKELEMLAKPCAC